MRDAAVPHPFTRMSATLNFLIVAQHFTSVLASHGSSHSMSCSSSSSWSGSSMTKTCSACCTYSYGGSYELCQYGECGQSSCTTLCCNGACAGGSGSSPPSPSPPPPSPSPPTPASAAASSCYAQISTGSCASHGHTAITSASDCEAAVAAVNTAEGYGGERRRPQTLCSHRVHAPQVMCSPALA